jgi:hypothetical protein
MTTSSLVTPGGFALQAARVVWAELNRSRSLVGDDNPTFDLREKARVQRKSENTASPHGRGWTGARPHLANPTHRQSPRNRRYAVLKSMKRVRATLREASVRFQHE